MEKINWFLVLGVFLGNWIAVPLVSKFFPGEKKSFMKGFYTGLIAAILTAAASYWLL